MSGDGQRSLPFVLVALFLGALAGGLVTLTGPRAYLPRVLFLAAGVSFALFLYRNRREILFLFVRARSVSEPGPATTWLLLAGILFVGSVLLGRFPSRYDFTERGLNRLSSASKAVLAHGSDEIELIAVYRETSPRRRWALDLLDVYKNASRRIHVEALDPERRPERARDLGLQRSEQILVRLNERIEEVSEPSESAITRAIIRLSHPGATQIVFTVGHGEASIRNGGADGLAKLAERLRGTGYRPAEINLIDTDIEETVATVAVIGPDRAFLPSEIERLGRYLDRGGRLLVCLEPGTETGLEPFLYARGVELDSLEVVDEGPATRGLGFGPRVVVVGEYPRKHPIGEGISGYTVFPGVRPVSLLEEAQWGVSASILLRSSPDALRLPPTSEFNDDARGRRSRQPLAVVEEWEVPGTGKAVDGEAAPEKPFARLLVMGDADWLTGEYLGLYSNPDLADRTFHWLASREFLLSIPPIDRSGTPLSISLTGLRTLFYLLQIALPLLLLGIGLWRWQRGR